VGLRLKGRAAEGSRSGSQRRCLGDRGTLREEGEVKPSREPYMESGRGQCPRKREGRKRGRGQQYEKEKEEKQEVKMQAGGEIGAAGAKRRERGRSRSEGSRCGHSKEHIAEGLVRDDWLRGGDGEPGH